MTSMFSTLKRPYKERSAEDTTGIIRDILKKHDLLPTETFFSNPFPEVYSVSLELEPEKGKFRTNGKGRSRDYSLASAYAEFMERLQNGLYASFSRTMQCRIKQEFGFYYDPREKFLSEKEFARLPASISDDLVRWSGKDRKEFVSAYYDRLRRNDTPGAIAVPFHSSSSREVEYLPLNLLLMTAGSNGMAAGNSPDEAIFQALCELMERWAAARVFYNRLTPPTIPETYLQQFGQEFEVIRGIERSGKYKVTVKDFSAGMRIPAIGLIVENKDLRTYRLNVGCDTSFQVALSRSLTEVFQGIQNEEVLDYCLLKIPDEDQPYFANDDESSLNMRYLVFSQFTKDNSGVFPQSLFSEEPSYQFDSSVFTSRDSYRQEVAAVIEFFHAHGHTVYIRDVSYLGFPSVFVYVPEISTLGRKNVPPMRNKATYDIIEWDKAETKICNIKTIQRNDAITLAQSLQTLPPYASITDLLNIKLKEDCPWSQMNIAFLLTQLWFKLGRITEAAESFHVFRKGRPDDIEYYQIMEKYLSSRASGYSIDETRRGLETEFGATETIEHVCDDMVRPEDIFQHVRLPECPDCSHCGLADDCLTKNLMEISHIVYPVMKETLPAMNNHVFITD